MSGIAGFDPDRFLANPEPAPVTPLRRIPPEWEHGLTILADRPVPKGASPDRWAQIVADATQIATRYQAPVLEAGWSVENLFGFDPDQPDGFYGLAVAMRGRLLIDITEDEARLKSPHHYEIHRPYMPAGCPLLWNFTSPRRVR